MNLSRWTNALRELPTSRKLVLAIFVFLYFAIIFYIFPATSFDWQETFYRVSHVPLHPYSVNTFMYPPWISLILYPFHYFSENISKAINDSLNLLVIGLLVIKRKGDDLSLILTLTSRPFLSLLGNGNIEWIPALGFILQNQWGLLPLLTKPQSGVLAMLAWSFSVKNKASFFLPAVLMVCISFIIWANWPFDMMANIQSRRLIWNYSLWPWSIPLGLGLLWYMFKFKPIDSELLGILATLCLIPYFANYSLTLFFTLLSISHRRMAITIWLLLWLILFI